MVSASHRSPPLCIHRIILGDKLAASVVWVSRYPESMTPQDRLQQHLDLCKRIYLRLKAEGKWPWLDQPSVQTHDQQTQAPNKSQSEPA